MAKDLLSVFCGEVMAETALYVDVDGMLSVEARDVMESIEMQGRGRKLAKRVEDGTRSRGEKRVCGGSEVKRRSRVVAITACLCANKAGTQACRRGAADVARR